MLMILLVVLVTLWSLFVAIRTLRLSLPPITDFELKRRLKHQDQSGQRLATRREQLPYILALRLLLSLIIVIVMTACSLQLWGLWGLLAVLALAYGGEMVSGWSFLVRQVEKIYRRYELPILRSTLWLRYVLTPIVDQLEDGQPAFFSTDELEDLIKKDTQVLSSEQKRLLAYSLSYPAIRIRQVMTAQPDLITVKATDTLSPVTLDSLHRSGHSSFPVMDEGQVVGVLHIRAHMLDPRKRLMRDAMDRQVWYVHQDEVLDHALAAFLRTRQHLCIVIDDRAQIVGLLTIRDVVNCLVGQVGDGFAAYDDKQAVAALIPQARQNLSRGDMMGQ